MSGRVRESSRHVPKKKQAESIPPTNKNQCYIVSFNEKPTDSSECDSQVSFAGIKSLIETKKNPSRMSWMPSSTILL